MNIDQIVAQLRGLDFFIHQVKVIPHGAQIDLGCGVKISVYRNGTVMAQGKFVDRLSRVEGMPLLRKILPASTVWGIGVK
ncbi:hypothetical protein CEK29_05510 [Bordetella genomosp. 5]|uniref:hypothetical protein n=1 Tax=Bordetella genomosp. 5 TaxID=1395608 RepID=UPI000B9EB925|nr:hypothetical protein [Bordetella genomosp. 5]OZI46328.1 hypothetical protein CEK29_05510 [Bordetella genomosp. 5]